MATKMLRVGPWYERGYAHRADILPHLIAIEPALGLFDVSMLLVINSGCG